MTEEHEIAALHALARAKGIDVAKDAAHLSLHDVAALAGENDITVRRAIRAGRLAVTQEPTGTGWRYLIALPEAARYVVQGGTPTKKKEA
mgnify:FL=1